MTPPCGVTYNSLKFIIKIKFLNSKTMIIEKCDLCKKTIKQGEGYIKLSKREDSYESFEFCLKCGKIFSNFLKKNNLLKR